MDDLKLFTPNEEKLAKLLKLVKQYSKDIEMEFELDKCAKCTFVQDNPTKTDNRKIDLERTIQQLANEASHKYLEVEVGHQICHKQLPKNTHVDRSRS